MQKYHIQLFADGAATAGADGGEASGRIRGI